MNAQLGTRGAELVARFLPLLEEHVVVAPGASPGAQLARVTGEVGLAARQLAGMRGDWAPDPGEAPPGPLSVAVHLLRAAAFSVTAAAGLDGRFASMPAFAAKDRMLEMVDEHARGWEAEQPEGAEPSADYWLRMTVASLAEAGCAAAELEAAAEVTIARAAEGDPFEEERDDEGPGMPALAEDLAAALFELATRALLAAEWMERLGRGTGPREPHARAGA